MIGLDDCPWYDEPEGKRPWWAHGDCGGRMLEDATGLLCERHWNAFNLSSEFNHWGTRKSEVGEGYCPECERENSRHYEFCPLRPGAVR